MDVSDIERGRFGSLREHTGWGDRENTQQSGTAEHNATITGLQALEKAYSECFCFSIAA
jgi:hypothetical protein